MNSFNASKVVLALFLALGTVSFSQAVDQCDHDRPKVCGGVTSGDGRIHDCMMTHIDELSSKCRKTVIKADQLSRNMHSLCAMDIQTFCAQYEPMGRARLVQCLQEHDKDLKAPCQQGFKDYLALSYQARQ